MRQPNHKPNSIVVFDPDWNEEYKAVVDWDKLDFKVGECVLCLGNIANVPGHCSVAKRDGRVIWMVHPEDFRKAKENEL
jgi:hypothetical protein